MNFGTAAKHRGLSTDWPLPRIVQKMGAPCIRASTAERAPHARAKLERRYTMPEEATHQEADRPELPVRRPSAPGRFRTMPKSDPYPCDNEVLDEQLPVTRPSGSAPQCSTFRARRACIPTDLASAGTPRAASRMGTLRVASRTGALPPTPRVASRSGRTSCDSDDAESSARWVTSPAKSGVERSVEHVSFAHINRLVCIAKRSGLPVDEVRKEWRVYRSLMPEPSDSGGDVAIDAFHSELRRRCHLGANDAIPVHLLPEGDAKSISFEAFIAWWARTQYAEEVIEPEERLVRELARNHGIHLLDVERIRSIFDAFDVDKNGVIDQDEFKEVLRVQLRVRRTEDLPTTTFNRYWTQVDINNDGTISFLEFLVWHYGVFKHERHSVHG